MGNKVYTAIFSTPNIAPAGMFTSDFRIFEQQREMKIKSISFEYNIFDITNGKDVPVYNNSEFPVSLQVGSVNNKIGSSFQPVLPVIPNWLSTGDIFIMQLPKQLLFDSFFASETIDFLFSCGNNSAAVDVIVGASIIVECEQIIKR